MLDQVTERVAALSEQVVEVIKTKYAKQPFGTVERSRREQKALYDALTPSDMAALVQKWGMDEVERYIRDMEVGHGMAVS